MKPSHIIEGTDLKDDSILYKPENMAMLFEKFKRNKTPEIEEYFNAKYFVEIAEIISNQDDFEHAAVLLIVYFKFLCYRIDEMKKEKPIKMVMIYRNEESGNNLYSCSAISKIFRTYIKSPIWEKIILKNKEILNIIIPLLVFIQHSDINICMQVVESYLDFKDNTNSTIMEKIGELLFSLFIINDYDKRDDVFTVAVKAYANFPLQLQNKYKSYFNEMYTHNYEHYIEIINEYVAECVAEKIEEIIEQNKFSSPEVITQAIKNMVQTIFNGFFIKQEDYRKIEEKAKQYSINVNRHVEQLQTLEIIKAKHRSAMFDDLMELSSVI